MLVLGSSLTVGSACGSSSSPMQSAALDAAAPDSSKAVSPCTTGADCSLGEHCVFAVAGGCAAKGVCHDPPPYYGDICFSYCGCDGDEVNGCGDDNDGPGSSSENARGPVSGKWPCADAGPDAGG